MMGGDELHRPPVVALKAFVIAGLHHFPHFIDSVTDRSNLLDQFYIGESELPTVICTRLLFRMTSPTDLNILWQVLA